jgi:hypothetical protein
VRKSLRGGDSESDSKGDSVGGTKLYFQGAHQGGFRGATRTLVSRFAHEQVLSLKEHSLKEPSLKEPGLSELGPKWSGLKKPSATEPGAIGLNILERPTS